jgi:DNA repair exonuclease SbcCD nuclease subunit
MSRILVIGDPHFRIDNVPEVELFIELTEKLARERSPDFIVILGDVLHTHERLHTIPLNLAYDFIKRLSIIAFTYVLVGNHDYIQNQQFLTQNHWMNAMKAWANVCIVDQVEKKEESDQKFIFCPYVPNGRFEEALNTLPGWETATCIFAHQEFYGCKMGAIVSVEGDPWNEDFPLVISGHIHSKQRPQKNILYTGSALQHAFGESEKNILLFCSFIPGKDPVFEEIDLGLPRKKIVYMDMDKVETYVAPKTDDDLKLSLTGSYEEFKAFKKTEKFKELTKEGVKVVFKANKKPCCEEGGGEGEIQQGEKLKSRSTADFKSILYDLIIETKDSNLYEQYELVVNNNLK